MKGRKPQPKREAAEPPQIEPPQPLQAEARREWDRIIGILSKRRVLAAEDAASLYIYVTSYAEFCHAQRMVEEHGTVIMSTSGTPVKNPYGTVQSKAWDRIRPLLAEFGLTPSARSRLKLDEDDDDEDFL